MALWFSGVACKWRVLKKLCHEFPSPTDAEHHLRSVPDEVSPMKVEKNLLRSIPDISSQQLAATPSHQQKRSNIIYSLAKAVGTMRPVQIHCFLCNACQSG